MKALLITALLLAVTAALTLSTAGGGQQDSESSPQENASEMTDNDEIAHGRYLVHDVCLCIICHSPKDAGGEPIESRLLTGGRIPIPSPYPETDWAFRAPKLRGLPAGWSDEELVQFLQTRKAPHGRSVRLPMPPFHLNERDARAVAAYLKSLN